MDRKDKFFVIFMLICLIVFALSFPGCRTVEHIPVHTTDTLYVNNFERDSTQVKDSVYVFRTTDSVFIYREKISYKDRLVTDTVIHTIYKEKPVEVIKTVEVKKPYSIMEKILMWAGTLFIVAVVGLFLFYIKYGRRRID